MSTALSGVRAHIATALANVGVPVYAYDPEVAIQPPAVVLLAGSPYRDPTTAWDSVTVGIDVRLVVSTGVGLGAAATMDSLIDAVCDALNAVQVQVGAVPAPTPEPEQAALVADIPTTTVWKDD